MERFMADIQIRYTHKLPSHHDAHKRILGVASQTKYYQQREVLADISSGHNSYYVMVNGKRANVVRAIHNGDAYIKTEPDGYAPNNLLNLPEPPTSLLPK
jgi:hypothetical protein